MELSSFFGCCGAGILGYFGHTKQQFGLSSPTTKESFRKEFKDLKYEIGNKGMVLAVLNDEQLPVVGPILEGEDFVMVAGGIFHAGHGQKLHLFVKSLVTPKDEIIFARR